MKKMYSLLFTLANSEKIIKNINIPACKNCIHFNHDIFNNDFSSTLNKCGKFGTKDIINDKIRYEYAYYCRTESKCGEEGKYFEKDKNVNIKLVIHTIFKPISLCFLIPIITFLIRL